MATIPQFDPLTSEALSPFLAGLSEGLSRLSAILNLTTTTITDSAMSEVYIGEDDRYRIYQVAAGNRLWLSDPAPVVKKNGSTITPAGANFTIDYIGGSIKFETTARLISTDVVTVSATRIHNASTEIENIKTDVTAVEAITAHFMGYYATLSDLQTSHVTGADGDFAIIGGTVDSIYMWDSTGSAWKDIYKTVDLSSYYTKTEANALLAAKEASITAHGATTASDLYYYGGRKTWQELTARVRATALTGINVATSAIISASDTVLGALGKLQAQITGKPFISGTGDPTTSTVGTIGQRYVNTSTGNVYRCTAIAGSDYTWVKQGSADDILNSAVTNAKLASMASGTIKGNASGSSAAPSDLNASQVRGAVLEDTSAVDAIADGDKIIIGDVSASAGSRTKHILWSAIKAALAEASSGIEATANKVTSISAESTDIQYPSAKCTYDAIAAQRAEKYTAVWDKVNAQCTRADSAAGITTTITNFCHRGTVNTSLSNPFNSIYPWSGRGVCNIDVVAYRALSAGDSLLECIVAWLGDPDFDYNHANGVWVYTPEFWYTVQDIGASRYFSISPTAIAGYIHAPEAIEGRWFGGTYTLTIDGVSKSCLLPKPGMPGKNVAVSTLHTYAKNWGASVEDIYSYSATDVLMIVEFATMNTQSAIGNGASDLYRQSSDTIQAAETASATVKVLTAAAANCIAGAIFDIGTTNGAVDIGSFIIASTALDTDPTYTIVTLTTDGSTPASVTVTTAHFWSVRGLSNTVDASIGAGSGYIGTNGKSHAYYRGQVAHANLYRYILGAYQQTGTGKIWIANSPAEADAYDALDTTVHKDTGFALPQGAAGAATEGYISALRLCPDVPATPFCESTGGSNANPVGDYCYVPALATANTILLAGGYANLGANCGRFCGNWFISAAASDWCIGALPVLKTPN